MVIVSLLVVILFATFSQCKQLQPNQAYLDLCLNCAKGSIGAICREGLDNAVTISSEPPQFVYRADFRPPSDIFSKGFESPGKNDNLIQHTKGQSTSYSAKKNTLFVSTSKSLNKAIEFAKVLMRNSKDPAKNKFPENAKRYDIFIYKIRADGNYFCMFESLLKAVQQEPKGSPKRKDYEQQAHAVAGYWQEWEACGGVKPEEVKEALCYKFQERDLRAEPTQVKTEANSRYKDVMTKGSNHVFVSANPN